MKREELPGEEETWGLKSKQESLVNEVIELELLKKNTIVIHGDLDEDNCNKICKKLLYLHYKKARSIFIILNSVGGEVYHGLLIFNTIEDLKKQGITVLIEARGLCASMGVTILMGGSERRSSKYTRFLLHEVEGWTYGKTSLVKDEGAELERVNDMLDNIIIERTKLSKEELEKYTKRRNWWLSAEEALKYGLVNEIV